MTSAEFWWLLDAKRPKKTWGKKYVYSEDQMRIQYEEMLKEHEATYGRGS